MKNKGGERLGGEDRTFRGIGEEGVGAILWFLSSSEEGVSSQMDICNHSEKDSAYT